MWSHSNKLIKRSTKIIIIARIPVSLLKKLDHEEIEHETEPYYKTNAITDYAVRFLEQTKNDKKPFFLYVPYESAHYPLQALPEDIAKFKGRYKEGWEVIRKQRFKKQKKLEYFLGQ